MLKLTQSECSVSDRMELTSRTVTAQGFLVAPAVIARTGVQTYKARELGIGADSGIDPNTPIRLYRPPDEVFAADSIAQWGNAPVTMGHPPGNWVDAKNWRSRAVGDTDKVVADGSVLKGVVTIRDAAAVTAVQNGKKFLSGGYKFTLDPTPGVAADGQAYDAIQRNILPNHVAIVDVPRGGPVCRIADSTSGDKTMRKLVVDGISFETEDNALADMVTKLVGDREALNVKNKAKVKIGDQEFSLKEPALLQTAIDGLSKENVELKAKIVTDEQMEKKVSARVKVVGDALKLVPDFKADGKTDVQIQREVITGVIAKDEAAKATVTAALDGVTLETADGAMLSTVFRILASKPVANNGSSRHTAADSALSAALTKDTTVGDGKKEELHGRDAYNARMENAWQGSASKQ